jgi:hypothetical protein
MSAFREVRKNYGRFAGAVFAAVTIRCDNEETISMLQRDIPARKLVLCHKKGTFYTLPSSTMSTLTSSQLSLIIS